VGVVLPVVALPLNPDMAEEVDPNMIELDWAQSLLIADI
jgi:hypothetical protein